MFVCSHGGVFSCVAGDFHSWRYGNVLGEGGMCLVKGYVLGEGGMCLVRGVCAWWRGNVFGEGGMHGEGTCMVKMACMVKGECAWWRGNVLGKGGMCLVRGVCAWWRRNVLGEGGMCVEGACMVKGWRWYIFHHFDHMPLNILGFILQHTVKDSWPCGLNHLLGVEAFPWILVACFQLEMLNFMSHSFCSVEELHQ